MLVEPVVADHDVPGFAGGDDAAAVAVLAVRDNVGDVPAGGNDFVAFLVGEDRRPAFVLGDEPVGVQCDGDGAEVGGAG